MHLPSLETLFHEHDGYVTDKWASYLPRYGSLFSPYRDRPVRLLEIGIQNGGSLEIWARYFPHARAIVGCDIDEACAHLRFSDPRIRVVVGDACRPETLERIAAVAPDYDLILDDGSHRACDIVRSFAAYFPRLAPGGAFLIEDLHCSYWEEYDGGLHHPLSALSFLKRLADILHWEHWGLPRSRGELLRGFGESYRAPLEERTLAAIDSIEFANSLCVIRKTGHQPSGLGPRLVRGRQARVFRPVLERDGEGLRAPDQTANHWAGEARDLAEAVNRVEAHCRELRRHLAERERQEDELRERLAAQEIDLLQLQGRVIARETELGQLQERLARSRSWRLLQRLSGFERSFRRWRRRTREEETAEAPPSLPAGYAEWVVQCDTLGEEERAAIRDRIASFVDPPLFSVVMPVYETPEPFLSEAIASVRSQLYPHWELCIADDASSPRISELLREAAERDPRIRWLRRETNGGIAAATNTALSLARGEFVAFLDHDDRLSERALYEVAVELRDHPASDLLYSDEDLLDGSGARHSPYFKPDWNLDLLLAQNFVNHLAVYRRSLLERLGGLREGFDGSQDYDLVLRAAAATDPKRIRHIPAILYHWRHEPTTFSRQKLGRCVTAARRAIGEFLRGQGPTAARAEVLPAPGLIEWTRVRWPLPDPPPLLTAIVPTRDRTDLLERCLEGLLHRTDYPALEVLVVDNESVQPETAALFERLARDPRVRILPFPGPFHYAAMNNLAARQARGELLALLNNDLEVIDRGWLRELVSQALRPEVGAVGAKLLYPDGRVQHAGVVLGVGSLAGRPAVAGHFGHLARRDDPGYFGQYALVRELSAVTGACLVLRKEVYEAVGGLDADRLAVAFNDVDLCLRIRAAGRKIVWTPYAELYHREGASRGRESDFFQNERFAREWIHMLRKWGPVLEQDPFYNPNFSRTALFALEKPPRRKPGKGRPIPGDRRPTG